MAAKPPKPPGKFLKSILCQNNNKQQKQQNNEEQEKQQSDSEIGPTFTNTDNCNTTATTTETAAAAKKPDCNCSNISIMHLFHEMKQEFPTIPDTVVAQCVNENCHQRENCIQMLRNELALNPIPVQSYPAKILHPPTTTNNNRGAAVAALTPTSSQKPPLQQKPQLVQQKPPLKPLRPIRAAPLQPCTPSTQNSPQLQKPANSPVTTTLSRNKLHSSVGGRGECNGSVGGDSGVGEFNDSPSITSPSPTPTTQQPLTVNSTNEVNNNANVLVAFSGGGGESIERNTIPKQRPTTLNLKTQTQQNQQQQQRQRLNIQLQKHFQEQRNKQHQQHTTKPTRKAPLPPIAPKPSQYQFNSLANSNSNNNNNFNDTLSSTHTSPLSESEISVSVSLSTPSPTSSQHSHTTQHTTPPQQLQTKSPVRHRSVITLQPEPPYTRDFASAQSNALVISSSANTSPTSSLGGGSQKSFTSVNLTLRPPVTTTSSPGTPGAGTALQPSTIDITAGPGFSGASGGGKSLHYSSTSYDARLGYQQNFQITVTDEGGVFSASRIRPPQQQQRCLNQVNICENQYDDGNSGVENNSNNQNYVNSLYAEQQQSLQQQQQLYLLQHQQFHNNNVVALQQNIQNSIISPQGGGGGGSGVGISGIGDKMCVPPQQALDVFTAEILQRQKKRRDKLAAALRENKKRLRQVTEENNLIIGPIPTGLSERLDIEIQKLRTDCQAMLRSSNPFTQPQLQQEQQIEMNQIQPQQQQPQPFPRQRPSRPPPRPPPPRQTSLDFIQHHPQLTPTYGTPPAVSLPNLYNTPSPIQQHSTSLSPSFYNHHHPHHQLYPQPQQQPIDDITTEDIYSDNDEDEFVDDGNDDENKWECNMCTFHNHPQLNICEACDNVRILPGTLPNLSRAISNNSANSANAASGAMVATSPLSVGLLSVPSPVNGSGVTNDNNSASSIVANGNLEHDTNLAQQQLQNFALHT